MIRWPLLLLLFASPALGSSELGKSLREVVALRGERIQEIEYKGDALPTTAQARIQTFRGRPFNPSDVRTLLLWLHENGVDFLVDISVQQRNDGVRLVISSVQKKKVSEIQFEGNASVSSNILLPVINIKEGYDFEKEVADDALQKLTVFYSKQGYLSTDLRYSFDQKKGVLKFQIHEGDPTLLASLYISPLTSIENKELRARYERDVREVFNIDVGDRIQRDKVLEGVTAVKDWLREHDFLMSRDPAIEYKVDEQGRVGMILNVQYGPRIRYGFRGNSQFSYRELMQLVGEVKEVASGSDYLAAVRRRVLEAYRDIGLANAQITTLVREDPARGIRYVSLIVNEGKKIRIERVNIDGIYSMSAGEAREKFEAFSSRLVQRHYFHEAGVNQGADLLADYLKSRGFLSAKMEYVKYDFNDDRSKVVVSLLFNEGIQTRMQGLRLSGVKAFTREEIYTMLSLEDGKPFDIFAFERGLIHLKERYQENGNLSVQLLNEGSDEIVRYSKDNSQVEIHLEIEEGPVYRVGDITVRGNQKTHARVVLRELPFITNDVLTTPLIAEAEENLRKLDLFSTVMVRPLDKPGADNVKDLLIYVEESVPGSFDIVPGYRNDLGLRLGFELGYKNLGGWNRQVNASAVFNRRTTDYRFPEYNFTFGFKEPYLANWPVTFTTNLSLFKRQFQNFDGNVNRLTVGVRRDLTKIFSAFLEYSFERIKVSNIKLRAIEANLYSPDDAKTDLIGALTPGFIVDSRNNIYNPTKGFLSTNRFEVASTSFGSEDEIGYYRATTYNSTYINLFSDWVLALAANVGWERSNVVNRPIPTFKLFRLGGLGSIRGMNEDQVETKKNINGILGFVNYRTELRVPLAGSVAGAVFLDAGNLMVDRFSLGAENLRSSIGTGLRYNTAVGPVVLDFAWRLQSDDVVGDTTVKDGGSDRFKIHFSIGTF